MKARAPFSFWKRLERFREMTVFFRSFSRFCALPLAPLSFFIRPLAASFVFAARMWRKNGFFVSDSPVGASTTCSFFAFLREGLFFGCESDLPRHAKSSAVFLDRVKYLREDSGGVLERFHVSRRLSDCSRRLLGASVHFTFSVGTIFAK